MDEEPPFGSSERARACVAIWLGRPPAAEDVTSLALLLCGDDVRCAAQCPPPCYCRYCEGALSRLKHQVRFEGVWVEVSYERLEAILLAVVRAALVPHYIQPAALSAAARQRVDAAMSPRQSPLCRRRVEAALAVKNPA